jgi:hypothetical protein
MPFGSLWIPVVVSAVVVFVASSILHMVLKYHQADYKRLPSEDAVREALGKVDPAPGLYITPYCDSMKEMGEPAMKEKFEKGPAALITMRPKGMPAMGKYLGLWFGFSFLVSFTAAYVARHTLQPGSAGMLVAQITGTVAFAGYGLSHISDSIWKSQPWPNTARALMDGLIYALLTGLTFSLLWPSA